MRKWMTILATVVFTVSAAGLAQALTQDEVTIKDVMKSAMKGGLNKTVAQGKASDAQKKELLELYKALHEAKPPKGEEKSWDEKTHALLDAAQAAVDGKADAGDQLKKAANCKACHDVHKGQ